MKVRLKDIGPAGYALNRDLDAEFFEKAMGDLELCGDAPDGKIRLDLFREGSRVFAHGTVQARIGVPCGRCLEPAQVVVNAQADTTFLPGGVPPAEPGEGWKDDTESYQGDEVDVTGLVRDQILLAVPLNPLCSEACRGLCPSCGVNLNAGPCDCKPGDVPATSN